MYDQRAHHQGAALGDDAFDGGNLVRESMDGFVRQNPEPVRPRQDAKGTVVRSRLVQMDPDGDDSTHGPSGRVGVVNSGFDRPRAPTWRFKALFEWQRGV